MGATVAFYTPGDTRQSHGSPVRFPDQTTAAVPAMTELYHQRAMSFAGSSGHVFGVETRANAVAALNSLPEHSVSAIYFVGHGTAGGYFFSGHPSGAEGFTASRSCVLEAPIPADFLAALARVLDPGSHVEIVFASCFTGGGMSGLGFLNNLERGLPNLPRYTVGMYEDYYETGYTADAQGRFQGWRDRIVSGDSSHSLIEEAPYGGAGTPGYQRVRTTEGVSEDPLAGIEADIAQP